MITTSKKTFPPSKNWKNWVSAPRRCGSFSKNYFKTFARRGSAVPGSMLGSERKGHRRRNGVTSMFAQRDVYTRRLGQKAVTFLSKTCKRHLHDWWVLRWVMIERLISNKIITIGKNKIKCILISIFYIVELCLFRTISIKSLNK